MKKYANKRDKTSLEMAYTYIKENIINLEFKSGQKLPAQTIAYNLQISRTPVREALGRLEQEGLVRRDGGWGYVVRNISFREIFELFKIRETLEVLAALEALPFLDKQKIGQLKKILDQSARYLKNNEQKQFRLFSRQFHMMLASYSNNDLLIHILASINDRVRLVGAMQLDLRTQRAQEILNDNRAIHKALEGGKADVVRAAVLAHVNNARRSLLKSAHISPSMLEPANWEVIKA